MSEQQIVTIARKCDRCGKVIKKSAAQNVVVTLEAAGETDVAKFGDLCKTCAVQVQSLFDRISKTPTVDEKPAVP